MVDINWERSIESALTSSSCFTPEVMVVLDTVTLSSACSTSETVKDKTEELVEDCVSESSACVDAFVTESELKEEEVEDSEDGTDVDVSFFMVVSPVDEAVVTGVIVVSAESSSDNVETMVVAAGVDVVELGAVHGSDRLLSVYVWLIHP